MRRESRHRVRWQLSDDKDKDETLSVDTNFIPRTCYEALLSADRLLSCCQAAL